LKRRKRWAVTKTNRPSCRLSQTTSRLIRPIREHPGRGDRTVSTTDPDACCGKHGKWFDGYLLDICVDSDSEIITQMHPGRHAAVWTSAAAQLACQGCCGGVIHIFWFSNLSCSL
jgi:hypothetical protein